MIDIELNEEKIHALDDRDDVVKVMAGRLRHLGAAYILVTGLSMPGKPIGPLVEYISWPDGHKGDFDLHHIRADDSLVEPGFAQSGTIALTPEPSLVFSSPLMRALPEKVQLVISLVNHVSQYQGLVIGAGAFLAPPRADVLALDAIAHAVFARLIAIGGVSARRRGALSKRECAVVELTARGHVAHQVAQLLNISQRTVHAHLKSAANTLATRNKTHTVCQALRYGQISLR